MLGGEFEAFVKSGDANRDIVRRQNFGAGADGTLHG